MSMPMPADGRPASGRRKPRHSAGRTLAALRALADGPGCTATNASIAAAAGVTIPTVTSHLERLEVDGALVRLVGARWADRVIVLLDHPDAPGRVDELAAGGYEAIHVQFRADREVRWAAEAAERDRDWAEHWREYYPEEAAAWDRALAGPPRLRLFDPSEGAGRKA